MPRRLLLPLAVLLCAATPAAAQTLHGRAVERETLRPLSAAFVVMVDAAGEAVAAARTDSAGAFSVTAPVPGTFALAVQRTGFQRTLTRSLSLDADESVALDVRMSPRKQAAETRPTQPGITGRLLDDRTGRPVSGARVGLLNAREQRVSSALTDSAGAFHFSLSAPGGYLLHAEGAGFQPARSAPLSLSPRDSVRVELRVARDAVLLAPLTVMASSARRAPALQGFEWRRRTASAGRFLGPDEIRRLNPFNATDAVQQVPFVRVSGSGYDRSLLLKKRHGLHANHFCHANVYIDGVLVRGMESASATLDQLVPAGRLTAVEVYPTHSSAPGEFPPVADPDCGVIVLWTDAAERAP